MSLDQIIAAIQEAAARSGPGQHVLSFGARSVPFQVPVALLRDATKAAPVKAARAEGEDGDVAPEEPIPAGEVDGAMSFTCSGTASSTSVDWYGTEMSRPCLDDMATQFQAGVGVFVGHGGFFGEGIEWDAEIGVTVDAEIMDADVAQPATAKESGAVCKVEMRFEYDSNSSHKVRDAVRGLAQRLKKKRPLGLSIGGWFRDVTYITGEDGDLERIIINKVDLDHLATTRRPANPDCLDMAMLGRAVKAGLARVKVVESAPVEVAGGETPAARSAGDAEPAKPTNPSQREIDKEDPKLSDSEYEQPPHDYVMDLKENWPDIWDAGGNERGNEAFDLWTRALDGDDAADVLDWISEREAWAARHEGDFLLAGVVAQLKWGVVGRRGWDHQREVVEARKEELSDEEETGDEGSVEDAAPAPTPDATASTDSDASTDDDASALSTPSASTGTRTDDTHPAPGAAREEIDMTPEQLRQMLDELLNARGITAPSQAAADLDAGETRTGRADPPAAPKTLTAPAGADLLRSRVIVDEAKANAGNMRADMAPTMRQITFGRSEGFTSNELIATYREPSPGQRRAVLLGLAHQLRTIGVSADLADVVQDSADVLALNVTGARGLRSESQADKDRIASEAPDLLLRTLRHASADGHPVFKAPGQREAIQRALTVSNASDKVTTALVSGILQQLSNVQLGARTQLRRIPGAGTNYTTPKRTVSNTLAEWVADGTAPVEDSGTWDQDTWSYKTIATRIKVTRKAIAQGAQWGDLVAAEALNKGEDFNRQEEVTIFQGDAANSLPTANAPNGLLTLIASTGRVANTSATAGDTLSLQKLDETIIKVKGRENKANLRIFASEKGHVYLNAILQADQTFQNVVMAQAGFVVQTYQGIPIIESSGIPDAMTWNGSRILAYSGGATTALVVVNLTHAYLVVLTPMTMEQVSTTTAQYQEYEMFADEVIVLDNTYGAAYLGGIKVV